MPMKQEIKIIEKTKKESKGGMENAFSWQKLAYTAIVIILYIPLVFVGIRTFLPEYTNYYDYPQKDCYMYQPYTENMTSKTQYETQTLYDECWEEQRTAQKTWDEEKRQYDVWKYLTVLGVVLLTLVAVVFVTLDMPIKLGLFVGAAITAFIATIQYFESESKLAFVLLVVVFIVVLYLIQKRNKLL